MIRKKNYKEEDHFTQYYSVYIPRSNGTKYTLFYKRYRPAKIQPKSVYQVVNNTQQQVPDSLYPVDRTLEVLSFDGNLDIARPFFRKIGKIRKFIHGETQYKGKKTYYSIVIFKYEFDLVKCFRDDYFQELINRQNQQQKAGAEEKQEYQKQIITTYMQDELKKVDRLEQLHKQGYNPITNKLGQFRVDYQANQKLVQDLPQTRRKLKKEAKLKNSTQ